MGMMKAEASRGDIKFSNNPQFPFLGCREKEIVENVKLKHRFIPKCVHVYCHYGDISFLKLIKTLKR